jgi:hypothetical protein
VPGLRDAAIRCCLLAVLACGGCGGGPRADQPRPAHALSERTGDSDGAGPNRMRPTRAVVRRPRAQRHALPRPVPAGRGRAFRLPPRGPGATRGATIAGVPCRTRVGRRVEAHLELFARGRVVPIPAGIGIAPPLRRRGAYVREGRCSYPVRTIEPTGLLELRADARLTLGELFAIWGQPLSRTRLAGFRGSATRPLRAYVEGVRWLRDPRTIRLRRHAVIVLELGPYVRPHARYVFPRRG